MFELIANNCPLQSAKLLGAKVNPKIFRLGIKKTQWDSRYFEKKKEESGRDFLSKNEKSELKETILDVLMHRIPSIPTIYDVLWSYEDKNLYVNNIKYKKGHIDTELCTPTGSAILAALKVSEKKMDCTI